MADSSRFEGQQIVNSINFFVDSERSSIVGDTQSKGDDLQLGFEGNTIECKDGEVIRLSLVDFHMPNNQYNIDARNSQATLICSVGGTAMTAGVVHTFVTRGNYARLLFSVFLGSLFCFQPSLFNSVFLFLFLRSCKRYRECSEVNGKLVPS